MTPVRKVGGGDGVAANEATRNGRLLKTGVVGTVVAAICCFTPLPVAALGAIGLSAWVGYADYVVFPALALCVAITVYAVVRQQRLRHSRR